MSRIPLVLLLLAGCAGTPEQVLTGVAVVGVGSIAVMHRSPFDAVYSVIAGKDCSIVRLDQGKSYCRPVEPPPEPPTYCTRSLAVVDCWRNPSTLPDRPPPVAQGPDKLTPEQEANRTRRWPDL